MNNLNLHLLKEWLANETYRLQEQINSNAGKTVRKTFTINEDDTVEELSGLVSIQKAIDEAIQEGE